MGTTNGIAAPNLEDAKLEALLRASPEYVRVKRQGKSLENTTPSATVLPAQPGGNQENHSKSLVPALSAEASRFMPVMSVTAALERRQIIVSAVEQLLVKGIDGDYGEIPGTKKKTLLQPGAQKLDNLFGLVPKFEVQEKVLDWTGANHDGEPFFYFEIRCLLWRGDYLMGEGIGSCNSWESKYRYRTAERACPSCKKENIRKSKEGGWYCWKKTGGCGAVFADGDVSIEKQETGKKPNPDIWDSVNTVMKMAGKRAHVAATINATSASEFFTQDLDVAKPEAEDAEKGPALKDGRRQSRDARRGAAAEVAERKLEGMKDGKSYHQVSAEERARIEASRAAASVAPVDAPKPTPRWAMSITTIKSQFAGIAGRMPETAYHEILAACGVDSPAQFKGPKQAWECYQILEGWIEAAANPDTFEHFEQAEAGRQ